MSCCFSWIDLESKNDLRLSNRQVLESVSMLQSKVEMGGCHDPKGKCHQNQIEMALLADSLRIWWQEGIHYWL
jgi:hypothetical protein